MFLHNNYRQWLVDDRAYARGVFAMLFSRKWDSTQGPLSADLRVLVRVVCLSEIDGQMTGRLSVPCPQQEQAVSLTLQGAFGNGGLPIPCPERLWPHLHVVPEPLAEQFWHSPIGEEPGEGPKAVYYWAKERINLLKRLHKNDPTQRN
jgi:hypothetical protein